MTKLLFENLDQLAAAHAAAKAIDPAKALDGMPVAAASGRRAVLQGGGHAEVSDRAGTARWLDDARPSTPSRGRVAVEGLPPGFGDGLGGQVAFAIAVAFSAFQLYTAAYGNLPSQVVRAMHVGFLLLLGFALIANLRATTPAGKAWFWALGVLGFAHRRSTTGSSTPTLIRRSGFLTTADLVVGTRADRAGLRGGAAADGPAARPSSPASSSPTASSASTCRRRSSTAATTSRRSSSIFAFGTEGIYGTPVYVSAAYIFIFVVFAAFLETRRHDRAVQRRGARAWSARWRGGPAQVCVLSSALMGTISGSGVANVVASGQFTIPLMKRFGFRAGLRRRRRGDLVDGRPDHAAGDGRGRLHHGRDAEHPLRRGGQGGDHPGRCSISAPASGRSISKPARPGCSGMDKDELPNPWDAGAAALAAGPAAGRARLSAVRRLHADLRRHDGPGADHRADPRHAARGADRAARLPRRLLDRARPRRRRLPALRRQHPGAGHRRAGRSPACSSRAGARRCVICVDSLAEGAKNALPVGIACAIVGIVIGTLTLTGIASTFIGAIIAIGKDNLFLSLVLTMLTCLVLGMGIPTIPNYIITSSLAGPALLELGVPLLVSHMFVFYFGIMADLTPPVALAAFAAAPMAKVSGHEDRRAGDQARDRRLRRAVHGGLHAGADAAGRRADRREPSAIRSRSPISSLKACLGIVLWGAAVVGFLVAPHGAAGSALVGASRPACCWCWRCRSTDEAGFALAAAAGSAGTGGGRAARPAAAHEPLHPRRPARR